MTTPVEPWVPWYKDGPFGRANMVRYEGEAAREILRTLVRSPVRVMPVVHSWTGKGPNTFEGFYIAGDCATFCPGSPEEHTVFGIVDGEERRYSDRLVWPPTAGDVANKLWPVYGVELRADNARRLAASSGRAVGRVEGA